MTQQSAHATQVNPRIVDSIGVYTCDSCKHVNVGTVRSSTADFYNNASYMLENYEGLMTWQPQEPESKDFPDVPDAIAAAASEVHRCLSMGANRGAIAIARAVVEATAKDKGVTKGTLESKIDELAKQSLIREDTREAAHEVRLDGNAIAHGDLAIDPPDADEAAEIVQLMDELLEEVYQSPARVHRVRANRQARAAATAAGTGSPP